MFSKVIDFVVFQESGLTGGNLSVASAIPSVVSPIQDATAQLQGVPATSDIEASSDADAPKLSDTLELVKSIIDIIAAIIVRTHHVNEFRAGAHFSYRVSSAASSRLVATSQV